jgi:hypothetical protein
VSDTLGTLNVEVNRRRALAAMGGGIAAIVAGAGRVASDAEARSTTLPFFDVTAFGATGDGSTDDTDAIMRAIDAAAAVSGPNSGGAEVFFPPGTYSVRQPIRSPNYVALRGAGPFPSTIVARGGAGGFTGDFLLGNAEVNQEFFWMDGLRLYGGRTYGVDIEGLRLDTVYVNSFVKNAVIEECGGPAIRLVCTAAGSCGPLTFEDIWVARCGDHNIVVESPVVCTWWRGLTTERPGVGKACLYFKNPGALPGINGNHVVEGCYQEGDDPTAIGTWIENQTCVTITNHRGGVIKITGRPDLDRFGATNITLSQVQVGAAVAIDDQVRGVRVPGPLVTRYDTNPAYGGLQFGPITIPNGVAQNLISLSGAYRGGLLHVFAYRAADGARTYYAQVAFHTDYYTSNVTKLYEHGFQGNAQTFAISDPGVGTKTISVTPNTSGDSVWRGLVTESGA